MLDVMTGNFNLQAFCTNKHFLHTPFNYRGTRRFRVSFSRDGKKWFSSFRGRLKDARKKGCKVPTQKFPVKKKVKARFVKFTVIDYYGIGGGLNFIGWKTSKLKILTYNRKLVNFI